MQPEPRHTDMDVFRAMMADDRVLYIFIDKHLIRSLYHHTKNTLKIPAVSLLNTWPMERATQEVRVWSPPGHADHMHNDFMHRILSLRLKNTCDATEKYSSRCSSGAQW